jgi:hypothetical protein
MTGHLGANITRTAFGPYLYEYMDFALALVSIGGEFALSYGAPFERGAGGD